MSKESKHLRKRAADQLRQSRQPQSTKSREVHTDLAASLKAMAANEEWLEGEPQRSRKRQPKKKRR